MAARLTTRAADLEVRDSSLARRVVSLDKELYSTLSLFIHSLFTYLLIIYLLIYLLEKETIRLSYRLPSHIFANLILADVLYPGSFNILKSCL